MDINLEIIDVAYIYAKKEVENLNTKELVPKMVLRRRLTRASKLFVELASKLDFKLGKVVFGTGYGELLATTNILNNILSKDGVSPTDFQNSVYNTAASYHSIISKNTKEVTTISSGENTSLKVLQVGGVKAYEGEEVFLFCSETLNIKSIDEVNKCIDFLECAVALKVKITTKEANLEYQCLDKKRGFPKSLGHMLDIAFKFEKNNKNSVIRVKY